MSDFQAILFDFGHTLVDFRRAEVALVNAYQGIRERLLEHAGEELPEAGELARQVTEAIDQMVQTSYREQRLQELDIVETMRLALAGIGIAISSELAHELAMLDHQAFSNSITIPEDNLSTLRELRRSGYKLGLVSNITLLPDLVKADLAALGITSSIDAVALSSDIGLRKPDPAIFGWVLDRLGVAPASAVFVGDRLRDDISGAQGWASGRSSPASSGTRAPGNTATKR